MSFPPAWRAAKRRYMPSAQVTPFENHHNPANWPLDYNPLVIPPLVSSIHVFSLTLALPRSLFYGNFWPLKRDVDPLRGWDLAAIRGHSGTLGAANDIYGKLFYYVRDLFKRFILKLRTVNVTFHVLPYSGYDLTQKTELEFDRIEVSLSPFRNQLFFFFFHESKD